MVLNKNALLFFVLHQGITGNVGARGPPGLLGERVSYPELIWCERIVVNGVVWCNYQSQVGES